MTSSHLAKLMCVVAVVAASGCSSSPGDGAAQVPSPATSVALPATARPSPSGVRLPIGKAPLRITFVDVGQGDAIVIRCGSWTGLIDGGPRGSYGAVAAALTGSGARRIDCLVITHPHADHIGGLPGIIRQFRPKSAVYASAGATATWRNVY